MTVRRKLWFVLLAAAANALVGVALGVYAAINAIGEGWEIMPWFSGGAWFLTAAGLWWLLVIRKGQPSAFRGAVAGGLTGILGHPLTFLAIMFQGFLLPEHPDSVVPTLENILLWLKGGVAASVFSLMALGWISFSAGLVIGLVTGRFQRKSLNGTAD